MTGSQLEMFKNLFPSDVDYKHAEMFVTDDSGLDADFWSWSDTKVISSYSRAQAIEDGVLVDLTDWARETGFTCPVAVTAALWGKIEAPKRSNQDTRGRAHDVLYLMFVACKFAKSGQDELLYRVKLGRRTETVKVLCGPGDDGELVMTAMLPHED
jgi:hypothetical protein